MQKLKQSSWKQRDLHLLIVSLLDLIWDSALVHLVQVIPHADSQPAAYLSTMHCVHHSEHFSSGEAQTNGVIGVMVKMCADVEVVSQVGLEDLFVN